MGLEFSEDLGSTTFLPMFQPMLMTSQPPRWRESPNTDAWVLVGKIGATGRFLDAASETQTAHFVPRPTRRLYAACRNRPSPVMVRYSISACRTGRTHIVFASR